MKLETANSASTGRSFTIENFRYDILEGSPDGFSKGSIG